MLEAMYDVLLELAPWLLLGAAIAGLLHVALPPNFVRRHLSGRFAVAKAVLLGVPLPLCSCGVIPAGLGLRKDGASDGAAVGFLISTPQTGVDSLLVSASFLGWPFALFKLGSAAVTGLVGGWLADAGARGSDGPRLAEPAATREDRSVRAAASHSLDILRTIWRWLVFGIVVSAAIAVYVPQTWLTSVSSQGSWVALLAALVVSLPLYVCATASIPIAAALVAGGFPAGAALVFLMAGPATNLATLGAVGRALGRRALAVYLGTIVVGSVLLGWAFDFVLPGPGSSLAHQHAETSWVAVLSAAGLLGLLAWFAVDDLRAFIRAVGAKKASDATQRCTLVVDVQGLSCQGCVRKLENALRLEPGVVDTEVSLELAQARVRGSVEEARVRELVEQVGFRVP